MKTIYRRYRSIIASPMLRIDSPLAHFLDLDLAGTRRATTKRPPLNFFSLVTFMLPFLVFNFL